MHTSRATNAIYKKDIGTLRAQVRKLKAEQRERDAAEAPGGRSGCLQASALVYAGKAVERGGERERIGAGKPGCCGDTVRRWRATCPRCPECPRVARRTATWRVRWGR